MGSGRWDPAAYASYSSSTVGKSTAAIFTRTDGIAKELDPKGGVVRESRDSVDNPLATPLIVGIDVTGSMGMIADALAREGLGTLFTEVLYRKPITDPHLMFMAIGDVNYDAAPLQVSQFEADARIIEQLTSIWLEKGGGGNGFESYNLPWYFAAFHTSIDSFEKRGKKGYLFTVGDEEAPDDLSVGQINKCIGDTLQDGVGNALLLEAVQKMYHVFHVVVEQGSHYRSCGDRVRSSWRELLGQRVLQLADYTKLSEVIVSAIQVTEGADKAAVSASWSGDTSLVVAKAIDSLPAVRGGAGAVAAPVTRF
jgi:hypothetical protein